MLELDAYIVIDAHGHPARLVNEDMLPVQKTKTSAARLAHSLDSPRLHGPRQPHRVVPVKIVEAKEPK